MSMKIETVDLTTPLFHVGLYVPSFEGAHELWKERLSLGDTSEPEFRPCNAWITLLREGASPHVYDFDRLILPHPDPEWLRRHEQCELVQEPQMSNRRR